MTNSDYLLKAAIKKVTEKLNEILSRLVGSEMCIRDRAITHQIANYPGVPVDISGEKLLTLMREQAVQYGKDYRLSLIHI